MAERVINGESYKFEKLNPFAGMELGLRVMQFLGPAWGFIDGLFDKSEEKRDGVALLAIGAILKDMKPAELVAFLKELCGYCQIKMNGAYEPLEPEFHLRSEMEILNVALFVLEVQFRDFFAAAQGSQLGKAVMGSPRQPLSG